MMRCSPLSRSGGLTLSRSDTWLPLLLGLLFVLPLLNEPLAPAPFKSFIAACDQGTRSTTRSGTLFFAQDTSTGQNIFS